MVYDKVAGAGMTIMGKGTIESQQDVTKLGKPLDKRVSVKEYIVGKLVSIWSASYSLEKNLGSGSFLIRICSHIH